MKQIFALFLILISLYSLATPTRASAFSECRSDRKGYCVRLNPEDLPPLVQRGKSSLLFAALPCSQSTAFPGLEFLAPFQINSCSEIGDILGGLYKFGVAIAGISALIILSWGGIKYMVSGAAPSQLNEATKMMFNALYGLVVIILSYLVLYTINPDFTHVLKIPDLIEPSAKTAPVNNNNPPPAPQLTWRCSHLSGTFPTEAVCKSQCIAGGCTQALYLHFY